MGVKVLVIPDKFKGTLTAAEAAEAIRKGWNLARPGDELELSPMSDGGDGFGEILSFHLGAERRTVSTVNSAREPIQAPWWWCARESTAIIESARIIGLALLPPGKYHPFDLDTYGLGRVLLAAREQGARRCIMGIGGSSTNDGGFGLACALGWRFLDKAGKPIERWTDLDRLRLVEPPRRIRLFSQLLVAVDVSNPLLGPKGATRIYGPQKGLQKGDFILAEAALRRLSRTLVSASGINGARAPGAGAAGGLGFGLQMFLRARLTPGFELLSKYAEIPKRLRRAGVVITGEGSIDPSTLMGKGVGEIAAQCKRWEIPCIGLAGIVSKPQLLRRRFTEVHSLAGLTTEAEARKNPAVWLCRLARQVAETWND